MANTYKFIDMVAREALAELHEQCELLGTVDRQYDDSFAKTGAKIGDTLRVRKPNEFSLRTGNAMSISPIVEEAQTITVSSPKGVDMEFNHVDLTLKTDSPKDVAAFTKRYIRPAISKLISVVEAEALAYYTKNKWPVLPDRQLIAWGLPILRALSLTKKLHRKMIGTYRLTR